MLEQNNVIALFLLSIDIGNIPILQKAHRLKASGYIYKANLRGLCLDSRTLKRVLIKIFVQNWDALIDIVCYATNPSLKIYSGNL